MKKLFDELEQRINSCHYYSNFQRRIYYSSYQNLLKDFINILPAGNRTEDQRKILETVPYNISQENTGIHITFDHHPSVKQAIILPATEVKPLYFTTYYDVNEYKNIYPIEFFQSLWDNHKKNIILNKDL